MRQDEEDFVQLIVVIGTLRQSHMRPRDGVERCAKDAEAPVLGNDADPSRCDAVEAQTWRLGRVICAYFVRGHQRTTTWAVPTVTGSPRWVSHQISRAMRTPVLVSLLPVIRPRAVTVSPA